MQMLDDNLKSVLFLLFVIEVSSSKHLPTKLEMLTHINVELVLKN